jgi:prepilin-type N-terminal cleavage/methylation domain-containing protein
MGQANSRRQKIAGFSLVEVMVAVVVMGIVTSQLLAAFSQQHTSSLEHERTIEIQQEARLITDVILDDVRTAGFMVPPFVAVASLDGGANGSDVLCVSDSTVISDAVLGAANQKFQGAELASPVGGNASTVVIAAGDMDIDGDGDDDFAEQEGILIGTGDEAHCAVIRDITGSTITFTPATDGGFSATTDDRAVPAIVYQVNNMTLTRNSMVVSNHIEDLQVQFGIDIDRNGTVENAEFPIHDLTGQPFEDIENVRISLTARELRGDPLFAGQFAQIANRAAGAADSFRRRRTTADTVVRNLQ